MELLSIWPDDEETLEKRSVYVVNGRSTSLPILVLGGDKRFDKACDECLSFHVESPSRGLGVDLPVHISGSIAAYQAWHLVPFVLAKAET